MKDYRSWLIVFILVPFLWMDPAKVEGQEVKVLVAYFSRTGNTEKMAKAVVEGVKGVKATTVVLKKVTEATEEDLFSSDGVIVGSPVQWGSMAGEVKTFFDNWTLKFGIRPGNLKMRDKVGAAFTTGQDISGGKELTLLTMLAAMLSNGMIIVSDEAFGAYATTGEKFKGVDEEEMEMGRRLGKRVANIAHRLKASLLKGKK